jgi:gas vesicle protein
MDDRTRVGLGALAGALLGALAGFLFFTDRGARVRAGVGPRLNELLDQAKQLEAVGIRLRDATAGGWRSVSDFVTKVAADSTAWPGGGDDGPLH